MTNAVGKIVVIFIIFLANIIFYGKVVAGSQEASLYISKLENFIKKYPNVWDWNDPEKTEELAVITQSINSDVSLEVQDSTTKGVKTKEIERLSQIPPDKLTNQQISEAHNYRIFYITQSNLLYKWEKELGGKDKVIVEKILPLIKNKKFNPNMRKAYVVVTGNYLQDFWNSKIAFSDEYSNKLMDVLTEIFSDDSEDISIREEASKTWGDWERRSIIILKQLDNLKNEPDIFKTAAEGMGKKWNVYIKSNRTARDLVNNKMFKILENADNEKIIKGGMDYFTYRIIPEEKNEIEKRILEIRNKKNIQVQSFFNNHIEKK